jgi:hypothetical protein
MKETELAKNGLILGLTLLTMGKYITYSCYFGEYYLLECDAFSLVEFTDASKQPSVSIFSVKE